MPFTPFHFGPGVLLKAVAPTRVSLTAFVAANVVIDVETAFNMLSGRYPLHATLHTVWAATLVGLAVGGAVGYAGRVLRCASPELRARPALVGGIVGGLSHSFLDGIMHGDIRPFLPLADANPLYRLVGLETLHTLCVAAGIAGLLWVAVRRLSEHSTEAPRVGR